MIKGYTLPISRKAASYGLRPLCAMPGIAAQLPIALEVAAEPSKWPRLLDEYLRKGMHPGPRPPPDSDVWEQVREAVAICDRHA